MSEKENLCERCGEPLDPESGLCPRCEPPAPAWMVWAVYVLAALFALGLIYRLIWH